MSGNYMVDLIAKVKSQYPTLTNKINDSKNYVYIVKNDEILIDVGRSTGGKLGALTGELSGMSHNKSGIAMMASALHKRKNVIFIVPVDKFSNKPDLDKKLNKIEKDIKKIVREHYELTDSSAGGTYCSGTIKDKDVEKILKSFLVEKLSHDEKNSLKELSFSFDEVLELISEEGDAWSNLMKNKKSLKHACVLLGKSV